MNKESKIQKDIINYLDSVHVYSAKSVQNTRSGIPDILCCVNGLFFAFEVKKSSKAKPSDLQEVNIAHIKHAEGKAYVVSSVKQVELHIRPYLNNLDRPCFSYQSKNFVDI